MERGCWKGRSLVAVTEALTNEIGERDRSRNAS